MDCLKRIAPGLVLSLILLIAIVLIANAVDDSPSREVQSKLDKNLEPNYEGQAAAYYLLGLSLGETIHAEEAGEKKWKELEALPISERIREAVAIKNSDHFWPTQPTSFPRVFSSSTYQEQSNWQKLLNDLGKKRIDQYIKLISYSDYQDLGTDNIEAKIEFTTKMLQGHRWFRIYLASLAAKGQLEKFEDLTRLENTFYRKMLTTGHLLQLAIAHLVIRDNALALAVEMKNKKPNQAVLESFKLPQVDSLFLSAVDYEMKYYSQILKMGDQYIDPDLALNPNYKKLSSLFYLPIATLNTLEAATREMAQAKCPSNTPAQCFDSLKWHWNFVRNPYGKYISRVTANQMFFRLQKLRENEEEINKTLAHFNE